MYRWNIFHNHAVHELNSVGSSFSIGTCWNIRFYHLGFRLDLRLWSSNHGFVNEECSSKGSSNTTYNRKCPMHIWKISRQRRVESELLAPRWNPDLVCNNHFLLQYTMVKWVPSIFGKLLYNLTPNYAKKSDSTVGF